MCTHVNILWRELWNYYLVKPKVYCDLNLYTWAKDHVNIYSTFPTTVCIFHFHFSPHCILYINYCSLCVQFKFFHIIVYSITRKLLRMNKRQAWCMKMESKDLGVLFKGVKFMEQPKYHSRTIESRLQESFCLWGNVR